MPVLHHFGLGRCLLGANLLSLLCILEMDGTADQNRNCQRSLHQELGNAVCAMLLQTAPREREMETLTHTHNCISQLLNIDSSQQGPGPDF